MRRPSRQYTLFSQVVALLVDVKYQGKFMFPITPKVPSVRLTPYQQQVSGRIQKTVPEIPAAVSELIAA